MQTLMNPAIPSLPRFPTPCTPNSKCSQVSAICCLRKNGEINGFSRKPPQMGSEDHDDDAETSPEQLQPFSDEPQTKGNDIWRLFKEAQQNILYLNRQRLMAVEELSKTKKEKQLLLDTIAQLEAEKQSGRAKDNLSLCWELLLRIDSLVLMGMIGDAEASDLRRLVMAHKVGIFDVFPDIVLKRDAEILAELRHFSNGSKKNGFHIIHICTEMEPLVSVGSLASYVTGLSRALQRKGHLVEVILPKYANIALDKVQGLREIQAESYSYFNGQLHGNKIWTGVIYGIGVTFIEPLYYSSFFSRESVYDYSDDFERFTYFSRASLDYLVKSGKWPDVLHIHNWETAIVGPLFWDIFVKQGLEGTRILLTCHGLDSQCLVQPDKLALCGLDPVRLHRPDRLQDNTKTHLVNILKGGVVYSNKVVIMSSNSKESIIRTMSRGLESTLAAHKDKLVVSPCGFDNSTWDPSKDKFLPENYSTEDMKGKVVCKVVLQQRLGLSQDTSTILVGCIFPEVSDLDLENLKTAVWNATKSGAQFIFMGNSRPPSINRALKSFQDEFKDSNLKFLYSYDEDLSHLVLAASDIMLCQSFHDPLLQLPLKALKYGAAPVAVTSSHQNFRYSVDREHEITEFSLYIKSTFGSIPLTQALDEIKNNPFGWKQKIMDAMAKDFSWDAECYDIHVSAYTSIKNL